MKKNLFRLLCGCLVGLSSLSLVPAQQAKKEIRDKRESVTGDLYVISAKAGKVNFIEGNVSVKRPVGRSGLLLKTDNLEIGDKVSTGANGRAEILLNPGSYLRLAENSQFAFVSTALDDLKLNLSSGSAILEVIAGNDFKVQIQTPKAVFYAVDSGIYRVEVMPDGTGKLSVWSGKAQIGDANSAIIKKGKTVTVNNGEVTVAKFDRDEKGSLELWSKSRAKELSKLNARLQRDDLRTTLINSFNNRGWGFYDSFGLWVFDRFSAQYCFLPFGYGWSSPYGYWFNRDIWYYRLPPVIYQQQPTQVQGTPADPQNIAKPRRNPPFAVIENNDNIDRRRPMQIEQPDFPTTDRGSRVNGSSFPANSGNQEIARPAPSEPRGDQQIARPSRISSKPID